MDMKSIMEIAFNIFYLAIIWYLVYKMNSDLKNINSADLKLAKILTIAFTFLALGDTGHVGFRVIAYINGGLVKNASLVGFGKMATAITVTVFYAFLIEAWKVRFNKKHNLFTMILFLSAIVRIIISLLPANQWGSLTAPFAWSMYRNIPLMIIGLSVAVLFLRDGIKFNDKTFKWISIMILISFGFYTPVILFASKIPTIGLLMIPKTVAYLVAAFIAYKGVFK